MNKCYILYSVYMLQKNYNIKASAHSQCSWWFIAYMHHIHASHTCITYMHHIHASYICITYMQPIYADHVCITYMHHIHASHICITYEQHIHASHTCITYEQHIYSPPVFFIFILFIEWSYLLRLWHFSTTAVMVVIKSAIISLQ